MFYKKPIRTLEGPNKIRSKNQKERQKQITATLTHQHLSTP
jgi:hypothetical protein